MTTLFIFAVLFYLLGSTLDIISSLGQRELNPLWRNAQGRFAPLRNLLASLIMLVVFGGLALWQHSRWCWVLLVLGGVRIIVALRNWFVTGAS